MPTLLLRSLPPTVFKDKITVTQNILKIVFFLINDYSNMQKALTIPITYAISYRKTHA